MGRLQGLGWMIAILQVLFHFIIARVLQVLASQFS